MSKLKATLNINVQIAHVLLSIFIKEKVSIPLKKVLGISNLGEQFNILCGLDIFSTVVHQVFLVFCAK